MFCKGVSESKQCIPPEAGRRSYWVRLGQNTPLTMEQDTLLQVMRQMKTLFQVGTIQETRSHSHDRLRESSRDRRKDEDQTHQLFGAMQ